jgi:hypothetical protein
MNALMHLADFQLLLEVPLPCYRNSLRNITSPRAFLHPHTPTLQAGNDVTSLRIQLFPTALRWAILESPQRFVVLRGLTSSA